MVARRSLRVRITGGALAVVVPALCAAGWGLIGVLEREMLAQIDATLTSNARFIDRVMTSPNAAGLPMSEGPTDLYVQFIGPGGDVLGASTAAQGLGPLHRGPVAGEIVTRRVPAVGDLRVLATPAPNAPTVTMVVARSADSVAEVRSSLVRALVVIVVLGSGLIGFVTWVVVGRALRPVEAMRRTVDAISDDDLGRRLDPPGTGDEVEQLAETLNGLLGRLDAALARERRFVADASHELRTPIAGVRALLETEPVDAAAVVEVRAEALARLGQLQVLVDDLLTMAKAGGEHRALPATPVDLDDLVFGQARQLERTTTLRIDTSWVSGGQVRGRDTDLGRMIENLATNAARHARSTVAFSVRQIDGQVELTVSDDGPGIPAADRARVFERFGTVEDSRSGGAGLGLSIAAAIVVAHEGSIDLEDAPGGGARFVVRLNVPSGASAAVSDGACSHDAHGSREGTVVAGSRAGRDVAGERSL